MFSQRMRLSLVSLALGGAFLISGAAAPAQAAEEGIRLAGFGPMVGFSSSPDQFTIGGFANLGTIVPPIGLKLFADIGFGDNFTVVTAGPSAVAEMPVGNNGSAYGGLFIGLGYFDYSIDEQFFGVDVGFTETKLIIGLDGGYEMGMENGNSILIDLKVGVSDWHPDIKAGVGYALGGN